MAVLAGCAAPPTDRVAETRAAPVAPADDKPLPTASGGKIRCVDEPVTGSLLPQRVCRTAAMWQQIEQQSKEQARQLQGPIYGPTEPASGPPL